MSIRVADVEILREEPSFDDVLITYSEALSIVKRRIPVDGYEIVEWMQECEAANMVLDVYSAMYSSGGGSFDYVTGDAYIPGVKYGGYRFAKQKGYEVSRLGYAVVEPRGTRVPVGSWRWVDPLRVIATVGRVWDLQFNAMIGVFSKYIRIPTKNRVSIPSIWGIPLPVVYKQTFIIPVPIATYTLVISSDSRARITVSFYDQSRTRYASSDVDIDRGVSRIVMVLAMPRPGYIEIQTDREAKITIDEIDRIPPT